MKRISVLMPTITGREVMREEMVAHFLDRTPGFDLEILSPLNFQNWPAGCNEARKTATGDYLLFTADDLEPLAGWADAMAVCLESGVIPAPQVWDFTKGDGPPVNRNADGPPGSFTAFTRIPALTRAMADAIGLMPIMDYYADNWISDKGRTLGWDTRVTEGFDFVHHWHQHGRLDAGDWVSRSIGRYNEERAQLGLPPVPR